MKYVLIGVLVVLVILFIINLVDLNRYVKRTVAIYDSKVKKKLKICFVSDLHNYSCTPKFYEDIKEYNPDVILCGGDSITANVGQNEDNAYNFLKILSEIAPTYTALGNHEYRAKIYPDVYGDMYPEFEKKMAEYGITILSNNSKLFEEENILVSAAEIDRRFYKKMKKTPMEDGYIESLLGPIDKDKYNILLAHNPDYFKSYNAYGSDLIFSGHLHGGLIRIPFLHGIAHPGVRFFPHYSGGVYNDNGKPIAYADGYVSSKNDVIRLIVSCGIGFHTLAIRLFNPGELIFVTIDSK